MALTLLVWAGCSSAKPVGPQAVMQATTPLDSRVLPWPSDALLGDDGKLQIATPFPFDSLVEPNLTQLAATLSEADGFATTRSIFFPVDADVVLDAGAVATVADLDDATQTWSYPLFYRAPYKQLVAMAPLGTALKEHHNYGCWITSGVHDAAGHALRPSPTMHDAIAGKGAFGGKASYQKLAKALASLKVKPLAATAFTTQTLTGWVPKVLDDLTAMPPVAHFTRLFASADELQDLFGGPVTTTRPGRPASGGVLHDQVGFVLEGTYDSPHYLAPTPNVLGLFDAEQSVQSVNSIPFILVLPIRTDYTNTPVMIFQHGIDSDRSAVLSVANDYAARGYAVLGIDELWHGSRLPGNPDKVFNLSGAAGSDGIGDPSSGGAVAWFFDFNGNSSAGILSLDVRCIRDNLRQAAVDLMQEVRLARSGDFTALAAADPRLATLTLDGADLVYTSESFGSILGSIVVAVDPMLDAAVLDVGGGGMLSDLVPNSPEFGPRLEPLVSNAFDIDVDLDDPDTLPVRAQMSLNLLQQVLELGDGIALSSGSTASKSLFFLHDFADETVPNQSEEALARAFGATQVELAQQSHALTYVTLPTAPAPYVAAPLHAVVELDNAGHGM
ncbi:MAG TPA: hypothetical protein VIA18_04750, partial [Polyangia bacterium]|nr:hypothetical protein [Polyangia bacterium]